ncbi:Small subunit (SSU) processome component [Komagataella phaffii CBS 7435]|uniref:Nucleolar protein, component of the small subunit (SSU) processome n=2 Tax=Komagataella phaffii TaxID=460519 RepID=C4R5K1_KOMPG|nr:Nucleolar protein, component of the small subunit (SSU) processome [Komagataella phaffii GS115]AOA63201.1 GQ67_03883T0 [Komagataella phaffii]CAH2449378.1 Small subunit (SSU) processome component [Komagataella phaffii CBS 7435]AOA68420.1 GQ68_03857T0 [Komagataella phaffii GS115]CAY70837.1 Nucleolar protein, component of the small subunit (SSU) processome [Komagataella phaffii GS115]CCA39372.1 Small subunit (SSU) processome component [Komagataella phaffii CBS 7435]
MNSTSLRSTFAATDLEAIYVGGCAATMNEVGTILATAVEEDVVISNVETNTVLHRLEGDGEIVTALQLTPDGRYLGVVSQSQQLRIFNLESEQFVTNFKLSSPAYIAAVDPTSTLFAFGGSDGIITVFDIENGYVTHSLKGHGTTVCSLVFHGELNGGNWRLASGDTTGTVKIWDLVKRKAIRTINEHNGAVRGLAFNADGERLLTGGRDKIVILWNTKTWKQLLVLPVKHQVESCQFTDNHTIFTAGGDCILKLWSLNNGKMINSTEKPLETSEELIITGVLAAQPKGSLYLVLSDQTLVEIDVSIISEGSPLTEIRRIAGNHGTIADMRYVGPELNLLALATNSPGLRVIDPVNKSLEMQLYEGHRDLLNALDVSLDGNWVVSASKDHDARLWFYNGGRFVNVAVFIGHAGPVTAVALSRTSTGVPHFIVTASTDLTIKKWKLPKHFERDIEELEEPFTVKVSEFTRRAHEKEINAIDVAPNDQFFATASYDKTAKVWHIDTGETVGILKGHKRGLWDIRFCLYDKLIVTASGDKTCKVWSLQNFTCLKTLEGHTNSVQRCQFFNKNNQIVTTGADGLIKIWDKSSGECIKTLDNHDNRIWALCLKNDGFNFVTADADGKFSFWEDVTDATLKEEEENRKARVEQEQSLANYVSNKDWNNAFLLALTLDEPIKLYKVLKASISTNEDPESVLGSFALEKTIKGLAFDQITLLFKRIRDWNTNSRYFEVAQKLIKVILKGCNLKELIEVPGVVKFIEGIIPYSERHFSRIDDLLEQTYTLDYAIQEMDKLTV